MVNSEKPKLVLFGDPDKGDVNACIEEFMQCVDGKAEVLGACGVKECSIDILDGANYAVVFGGDGSIISVARQISRKHIPVIGVNLGKLGYLAEFSVDELREQLDDILAGKNPIEKRMMLHCSIKTDGHERFSSVAINEVFITAGPPFGMVELGMHIGGQNVTGSFGDGLIVSTPTGSTAYNLSAGGPILSGSLEAVVITAICPHSLSYRPIVIGADKKIEIKGIKVNPGTTVSVDGQVSARLHKEDKVIIERHGGQFLIVNNPRRTQWDTLSTKLRWAEKPHYKSADNN